MTTAIMIVDRQRGFATRAAKYAIGNANAISAIVTKDARTTVRLAIR